MSGLAIATSYEESVGSCGPPTPTTPPPPASAGPRSASVRRQLDFTGGGDLEDDDDELLCRLADDFERGYSEAKQRAPPCVCGRGVCAVERDGQCGRLKYVCPSRPKCKHVAFCEEVDLNPQTQPTSRSHPKPSNPCTFNDPSNHMAGPRTPVNVSPQVTGATTPVDVHPQVAGAPTLFIDSPQGAATQAKFIPQVAGTTTPGKVSPQRAGATTRVKVSFQGAKLNGEGPLCQCTAGNCIKSRVGNEDCYVCPIPKGKGACSYKVLVRDVVKDTPSAEATPYVHQESPNMLHQPIAAVNTPSKSPIQTYGNPSPISPNSNDVCYRCKEKGHWMRDCPKQQSPRHVAGACFQCGMVGHWRPDCPQLKGS
ncbi:hypothetical protein EJB05_27092 [Eragrostis curvula]|uniref:CCHC-type domain-containing protein n=1 Tax=Eragrostis curvula TaxID=38414 RepID=A0A5J9ULK2_9POAL|nr:hypothetical protein EJB05_27092 [Eragrostis curvula]